jgi:hypothetical protein
MEGYLVTRMSAIVKYSVGEPNLTEDCNVLNVFINGDVVSVPVDTNGFTEEKVQTLFTAVKNAFINDTLDMFFDYEVIVV